MYECMNYVCVFQSIWFITNINLMVKSENEQHSSNFKGALTNIRGRLPVHPDHADPMPNS